MDTINEVKILTNVRLSETQKFILAKLVLPESTPHSVYSQITTNKNIVVDRDTLAELGLLYVDDDAEEAEITDEGKEALENANLIDPTGVLTPEGEKYAYAANMEELYKATEQEPQGSASEQTPESPSEPSPEPSPMGISPEDQRVSLDSTAKNAFAESWSMIAEAQEELNQREFLKKTHKG
jgi:hypothetical protein